MRREIAAKRYAEAAFQIGRDQGTLAQWRADLQTISAVFGDPQVLGLLENAKAPWSTKNQLLDQTLTGISPLAGNFARLLVQRRRAYLAPQIAEQFRELMDEHLGIAHAEVTTVVTVGPEERQAIADRLSALVGKQVQVEMRTDPSIIGGMVARIGDTLIDGSTRTRLVELRRRLETRA